MTLFLVTGGAGFIGSHIVQELLGRGHRVRVFDNFSTGRFDNLSIVREATKSSERLDILEGDLRSYHLVHEAVQGVEYILHQAALPSVPRSVRDPITSNDVNVAGTLNLLHAAHKVGVKRFINASSSSVYGDNPTLPKIETMSPLPRSPYAISKLAAEQYCRIFTQLYGIETVSLRYFNVFGPRQDPNSLYSAVVPRFITAAINDQIITVHGDGLQSRDFTYIDNVVAANLLACEAPNAAGEVINVSCGERYSLLDIVAQLELLLGKSVRKEHDAFRAGDVKHSQASIERARTVLNYEPVISFHEGIRRTVEWYKAAT
jgi:nucleoside-diphosphate-sugar epimerase